MKKTDNSTAVGLTPAAVAVRLVWRCREPRKQWTAGDWTLTYYTPEKGAPTWILTGHARVVDMETKEVRAAMRLAQIWIKESAV